MTAHDGTLLPGSGCARLQCRLVTGHLGTQRLYFRLSDTAFRSDILGFRQPAFRVVECDAGLCLFGNRPLQRQAREFAV